LLLQLIIVLQFLLLMMNLFLLMRYFQNLDFLRWMRKMDNVNRSGHKANKHTKVWANNALMNGQNFEVMI
jgi:hypothetical protein